MCSILSPGGFMDPAIAIVIAIVSGVIFIFMLAQIRTIPQSTVGVITLFGKYHRLMREGLNFKFPWESVYTRVSLQNRALQMEFQAITLDQANVKFSTMIVYAVANAQEDTVHKATFSFASG